MTETFGKVSVYELEHNIFYQTACALTNSDQPAHPQSVRAQDTLLVAKDSGSNAPSGGQ